MTNRERLHKVLDLEGLLIQPLSGNMETISLSKSKKRPAYIKCITSDEIASELMQGVGPTDKGLIGLMIFVPKSQYLEMHAKEGK